MSGQTSGPNGPNVSGGMSMPAQQQSTVGQGGPPPQPAAGMSQQNLNQIVR